MVTITQSVVTGRTWGEPPDRLDRNRRAERALVCHHDENYSILLTSRAHRRYDQRSDGPSQAGVLRERRRPESRLCEEALLLAR